MDLLQLLPLSCPAKLADQHTDTGAGPHDQAVDQIHDGTGRTDARERKLAEILADDDRINDIIELLEQIAADDGQGKGKQSRQLLSVEDRLLLVG